MKVNEKNTNTNKSGFVTTLEMTEEELSKVSGGSTFDDEFITTDGRWESGGDHPLYAVGDYVNVRYHYWIGIKKYWAVCYGYIIAITPEKSLGIIHKEWGYDVEIIKVPPEVLSLHPELMGYVVKDVMEPCVQLGVK